MPPCGYRDEAISGIELFLSDNLAYFIELYRPKGISPNNAIAREMCEIDAISRGKRGGRWSAATVEVNRAFYIALAEQNPYDWEQVELLGRKLVQQARSDLASLDHKQVAIA